MDARDMCRRLNCTPMTLSDWVDKGCPVVRHPPWAEFQPDEVRDWLAANGVTEWPEASDADADWPIRVILKAVQRRELTPWQAEKVMLNLGSGDWG